MAKLADMRELFEAGGYVEGDQGDKGTQNLQIYKSGETTAIYPNKESAPEIKNNYSVSLNKETGNVKISAPEAYFKTQSYQEKVKPVLEAVSQNYKLNPEYKYALLNDEKDTKNSEDWIKEIEKEFSKYVSTALSMQAVKDETKKNTGLDLTDEQVIKMSSVALERQADGSVVTVKDDTVQSLPESVKNMAAFKNLQGWQDGEVTYKNLMESWNRENTSDEDILQVYDTVDEYFRKGEFTDADEYAEMVAFSQFIADKHPETGFWRGVGDIISNVFYNVITGAAEFDVGIMNGVEGILNFAGTAGASLAEGEWTGKPATGELNFVRDYLAPELESQVANFQSDSMKLNEAAGTVGAIVNGITPLLMQVAVGNALGRAAANGISAATSKLIAKTGEAGLVGAAEGMTAEQVAVSALNGTNFLMRVMSANKANGIVASAVKTLQSMQSTASVATTAVDLGAQIIVDVTVTDHKLTRQLLDGNVSDEVKQYILQQIALDAGGWTLAVGGLKAAQAAGKTDVGRVVNAAFVPRISKWSAKIGDYTDTLKTNMLHGGDANWNKTKADKIAARIEAMRPEGWQRIWRENRMGAAQRRQQNLTARRMERLANQRVGEMTGQLTKGASSWADIVANANRMKLDLDMKFVAAHNLADRVYKGDVQARVSRVKQEYTPLSTAMDKYTQQLTRVLRAEDTAGLARGSRAIDVGEGRSLSQLSEESNKYLLGSYRMKLGEDVRAERIKRGEDIRGVEQEIEYYAAYTEKFRKEHPALAAQLDELERLGKTLSAATQDARVFEGVLDEATLLERRNAPEFRQGYLRTQRMKEWDNYQKRGGELNIGELRDDQHLKWGFGEDGPDEFQDVTFTLFDDITQLAKQSIRKEEIGYLEALGEKVEVMASGKQVKMAKTVNRTKEKAIKEIQRNTERFTKDMSDDVFKSVFELKEAKSQIMTAQADNVNRALDASRAKQRLPRVTARDRKTYLKSLSGDGLDDFTLFNQTSPFATPVETEQDFQEFLSALDKKTRELVTGAIDARAGTLFDVPKTKAERLAELPKLNEKALLAALGEKKVPTWAKGLTVKRGGQKVQDLTQLDDFRNTVETIKGAEESTIYTLENFNRVVAEDSGFLTRVKREYVLNDKELAKSPALTDAIARAKQEQAIFDAETLYAENVRALEELKDRLNLPGMKVDLNQEMDEIIDTFIESAAKNEAVSAALRAMEDGDEIIEYATLKSLSGKKNLKTVADKLEIMSERRYNQILTENNIVKKDGKSIKRLTEQQITRSADDWARQTRDWFEDRVNQRYGQATTKLRELDPENVDFDDLFGKVDAINKEITRLSKDADVVKTYDDVGREEYVRLSPVVANMITTMPTPLRRGLYGTVQDWFVKAFRMGTTGGLVPASLFRQGIRDPGLAFASGGATMTSSEINRMLDKVYGPTIASYYKQYVPDVWETLLARAEGNVGKATSLAVEQEMNRAATYASDQVQSKLYQMNRQQRIARNPDGTYDRSVFEGIQSKAEDAFMATEKLNNMRESKLRIWTYQNAYLQALNNGHSIPIARKYAEMIQAEATTNFSRQTYHLANLSHTVPYLGAAINGYKSFWRLYALDPVGVTTRIVGGYVLPLIALSGLSLREENREVYRQIPEWEKNDNLVFVINGQKFSIPIPQEISTLVRPIQSWIETMAGANDHSFEELMANNIAGFFPYDLQGFVNIDSDRILADNVQDDVWNNHLLPGFSVLSSQMMAPLAKSTVMWGTGYDPYTRKKINTSYNLTDPETGEALVVDYKSGELAKGLASVFKGNFRLSAQMAQAIFNNLLGSNNTMIIDGIADIAASVSTDEGVGVGLTKAAERVAGSVKKPFVIENYGEQSNLAWRRGFNQLMAEKNELLQDGEYQADLKMLAAGQGTEEANAKALGRIKTKREQFQEKVLKASQNLIKEYGGTLDRYKFAGMISLMTFDSGNSQDPTEPLEKEYDREGYNLAKAKAIETMARMGFDSPNDMSIMGYYGVDKSTGEISFQLNSPLAILDYERSSGLQSDVAWANIKAAVNEAGLWDAHESIKEQVQNIRNSKKKLTNSDYATIDAIYINWNAQVAKTIAPYIARMTPEAAINNTDVLNYLYPLIEVPTSWETNDKGRYVSLGSKGNKKRAYYESWIKSMFSVNDKYKGQY